MTAASVLAPVFVPVRVSVRVPVCPLKPIDPVLVKLIAPDPEASIVPLDVPIEKSRSVETAAPVYWRVPPLRTRFAAALVEAPILLLFPPLARELTDRVPPVILVAPV